MLGLEDQRIVALAPELERGDEPGDAATDDDDPLRATGTWLQPLLGNVDDFVRNRRQGVGVRRSRLAYRVGGRG